MPPRPLGQGAKPRSLRSSIAKSADSLGVVLCWSAVVLVGKQVACWTSLCQIRLRVCGQAVKLLHHWKGHDNVTYSVEFVRALAADGFDLNSAVILSPTILQCVLRARYQGNPTTQYLDNAELKALLFGYCFMSPARTQDQTARKICTASADGTALTPSVPCAMGSTLSSCGATNALLLDLSSRNI